MFTKGAAELVLDMCSAQLDARGGARPLSGEEKQRLLEDFTTGSQRCAARCARCALCVLHAVRAVRRARCVLRAPVGPCGPLWALLPPSKGSQRRTGPPRGWKLKGSGEKGGAGAARRLPALPAPSSCKGPVRYSAPASVQVQRPPGPMRRRVLVLAYRDVVVPTSALPCAAALSSSSIATYQESMLSR